MAVVYFNGSHSADKFSNEEQIWGLKRKLKEIGIQTEKSETNGENPAKKSRQNIPRNLDENPVDGYLRLAMRSQLKGLMIDFLQGIVQKN